MANLNNPSSILEIIDTINGKQDTLVSGTNIKTVNNTSLLGSGNIDIQGGGTSTDVQINGTSITSSNVANIVTNSTYNASSNKIATMSDLPTGYEVTANKVTSLSSSSTDTQYPSAKCVYDELQDKQFSFTTSEYLYYKNFLFESVGQISASGITDFIYDGTQYCVLCSNGTIYTSTDLETWTSVNTGLSNTYSLLYDGTNYYILITRTGQNPCAGIVYSSELGTNWSMCKYLNSYTIDPYPESNVTTGGVLAYNGTKYIVALRRLLSSYISGYFVLDSLIGDGNISELTGMQLYNEFDAINVNTNFVMLSRNGTISILNENNLLETVGNISTADSGSTWVGIAYNGSEYMAVSSNGYVSTSSDLTNWSTPLKDNTLSGETIKDIGIVYADSKFLAINADRYILQATTTKFERVLDLTNRVVTEFYHSGAVWYRVWSDGFIEQGGRIVPDADANLFSIAFPKAFTSSTFPPKVITTQNYKDTTGYSANTNSCTNRNATLWSCTIAEPTTTGFVVNRVSASWRINWYACGY